MQQKNELNTIKDYVDKKSDFEKKQLSKELDDEINAKRERIKQLDADIDLAYKSYKGILELLEKYDKILKNKEKEIKKFVNEYVKQQQIKERNEKIIKQRNMQKEVYALDKKFEEKEKLAQQMEERDKAKNLEERNKIIEKQYQDDLKRKQAKEARKQYQEHNIQRKQMEKEKQRQADKQATQQRQQQQKKKKKQQ